MAVMTPEEIAWYVSTGEPLDKAGSYAIQDLGAMFVEEVFGNYTNVVGLPLPLTRPALPGAGVRLAGFRGVRADERHRGNSRGKPQMPHPVLRLLAGWLIVLALAACGAPRLADGKAPVLAPREPANVMSYEVADWLERDGRAELEKPELVIQAMELKEGMNVAEIGAGTGFFSRRIAKAVGPTGKVYAEDIQPQMIELLKQYTAKEGVAELVTVLGTETDPKLPAGHRPHPARRRLPRVPAA